MPLRVTALGDATRVGPEVAVKALADPDLRQTGRWLVVGQEAVLPEGMQIAARTLRYDVVRDPEDLGSAAGSIGLLEVDGSSPGRYRAGCVSRQAGHAAALALRGALDLAMAGSASAVVYAPLNKEALHRSGLRFVDEIHLFAAWVGREEGFSEVNLLGDLWLFRVTSHIALERVASEITTDAVLSRILFARDLYESSPSPEPPHRRLSVEPACRRRRGLRNRRGAANRSRYRAGQGPRGGRVRPLSADTIFIRQGRERFDALLAMCHDQGQIGLKLLGFDRGVPISGGVPVTAVTPAHGTAFDIAGQGVADARPMEQALRRAVRLGPPCEGTTTIHRPQPDGHHNRRTLND